MSEKHDYRLVLNVATLAGQMLLENGAETHRVEDTISRICRTSNLKSADTFATPTGIFVCIRTEEDEHMTTIRRVKNRITNLSKISSINQISRELVSGKIDMKEGLLSLEDIRYAPPPRKLFMFLSAGVSSCFFAIVLGGSFVDGIIAGLCGAVIHFFSLCMSEEGMSAFLINLIGGAISATIAIIFSFVFNIGNVNNIIIGAIMPLLPGMALTNSIRDAIYGDLVSGVARAAEALLIAISIAAGVGVIIRTWFVLMGGVLKW